MKHEDQVSLERMRRGSEKGGKCLEFYMILIPAFCYEAK